MLEGRGEENFGARDFFGERRVCKSS